MDIPWLLIIHGLITALVVVSFLCGQWPIFQGTPIERIHRFITFGAYDYFLYGPTYTFVFLFAVLIRSDDFISGFFFFSAGSLGSCVGRRGLMWLFLLSIFVAIGLTPSYRFDFVYLFVHAGYLMNLNKTWFHYWLLWMSMLLILMFWSFLFYLFVFKKRVLTWIAVFWGGGEFGVYLRVLM